MKPDKSILILIFSLTPLSLYGGDIEKIAWLHIEDNQLLVARSKGKDLYYVPGGKREDGESDLEALAREVKEEVSVDIKPETIRYYDTLRIQADGKPEGVMVKITYYFAGHEGYLKANSEIEELKWVAYQGRHQCASATRLIIESLNRSGLL